jgi:uncharacterized protein (TIRG00374 family)
MRYNEYSMSETHFLRRNWKLIFNIFTVGLLIASAVALRHQIFQTIDKLGKIHAWALLLIIPIEAWNYDAYARMYRSFFRTIGNETTYRDMYKVTLELNLINHLFPSGGVSGFSYFSLRLKQLGISTGKATLVQTMRFVFLFLSFEVYLFIGLLFLALGGHVNNLTILVSSAVATVLFLSTAGLAYIISSEKRINGFFTSVTLLINWIIHIVRPKHPETINIAKVQQTFTELHENYMILKSDYRQLKMPMIQALIANLTELLAVYVVYLAFGHWINPGALILAYAVANVAGLVSVLPGGIGIYEALMTAVLATVGVSPAISIPVTVMYRVVNIGVQVIPGYYFYHRAFRGKQTHKPTLPDHE